MSENMIAIILYIGILAMAGTVLVLTIIYFVRPPSTHTGKENTTAEDAQGAAVPNTTEVQAIEVKQPKIKKVFKIPFIKVKPANRVEPIKEEKKLLKKIKETRPTTEIVRAEKKEKKSFKIRFGKDKPEKPIKTATQNINKPENKESLQAPQAAVPLAQTTQAAKPVNVVPPAPIVKNDIPKGAKPNEPVKAVPPAAALNPVKPATPVIAPKPVSPNTVINEKKPVAAEAKKEPEVKMEINNVKPGAGPTAEKPKTPEPVKPPAIIPAKKTEAKTTTLDDMSKMFSKDAVDDSEATKLAKDMKDVEINNLIKEGQDLINLLKRNRS